MNRKSAFNLAAFALFLSLGAQSAPAQAFSTSGRLLLTQGVTQIEGSAGGGLTPWAIIGGYDTEDQVGANVSYSEAQTQNFSVESKAVMVGLFDRVELSFARETFNTRDLGHALGIGQDYRINQNVFGLKVRVWGDAVLDQDSWWMPAIAVGAQYKKNESGAIVESLGATGDSGTDFYVNATKVFLNQSFLVNVTVRETRANQLGFLGFGGNKNNDYRPQFEGSLAYIPCQHFAVGGEYRMKPNNLQGINEDPWTDLFIAWTPTKNISLTAAYLNLGSVATQDGQSGSYASLQIGF